MPVLKILREDCTVHNNAIYIYIAVPVDQGEFIEHAIFAVPVLLNIQLREDCT